jgi:glycosyltransferase involved in cell wall biosynthesis
MNEMFPIRVLYHRSEVQALAAWRCLWPAYQLSLRGEVVYSSIKKYFNDALSYISTDVVVLQRSGGNISLKYIEKVAELGRKANFKLIYDVDDILFLEDVSEFHYYRTQNKEDCKESIIEIMHLCDEITVSTPFLKNYYQKATGITEITVLPNRIPFFWAGNLYSIELLQRNFLKHRSKPRVVYAGSSSHIDCERINGDKDDFYGVLKAIEATRKEFKWVFIGSCPYYLLKYVESKEMEYYHFVELGVLPRIISSLEPNMMIAPLADNPYNHAKSPIKFLEAAALGIPIACQDITPYKQTPLRFKTGDEMVEKIRETLKSEEKYLEASLRGREIVDQQWLEIDKNISQFRDVYTYPYGDVRRSHLKETIF